MRELRLAVEDGPPVSITEDENADDDEVPACAA